MKDLDALLEEKRLLRSDAMRIEWVPAANGFSDERIVANSILNEIYGYLDRTLHVIDERNPTSREMAFMWAVSEAVAKVICSPAYMLRVDKSEFARNMEAILRAEPES